MYKRIMVAVDGSKASQAALDEATRLAKLVSAEVLAVSVIIHTPQLVEIGGGFVEDSFIVTAATDASAQALAQARACFAEAQVLGSARAIDTYGEPIASTLIRMAEEFDADLIVMGTHGRTGVKRLLLGSVAESLLREVPAPVPVLLVKEQAA